MAAPGDEDWDFDEMDRRWGNRDRFENWLKAIETFDRAGKQFGQRDGPVGMTGQRLAEEIACRCEIGRNYCEATIGELADGMRFSRGAVQRAASRLVEHGFLEATPAVRGRKGIFRPTMPATQVRS